MLGVLMLALGMGRSSGRDMVCGHLALGNAGRGWRHVLSQTRVCCFRRGQVYRAVQELLPEVAYNAPARILTLRAAGARKQPRLPGERRI